MTERTLYRAISKAELDDWRESDLLVSNVGQNHAIHCKSLEKYEEKFP